MEICANDPDTFIRNERYYLEERVEMNGLGPKTAAKLVGGRCLNVRKSWPNFLVPPSRHRLNWVAAPQNKALFGSYLLAKFLIAWKCVPTIRPLSSKIEGTILKSELRWMGWDPEPLPKLAEGRCLNVRKSRPNFPTLPSRHRLIWVTAKLAAEVSPLSEHVLPMHAVWGTFDDNNRPRLWGREEIEKWEERKEKKIRGVSHLSRPDLGLFYQLFKITF